MHRSYLAALLIFSTIVSHAQQQAQDTVYLMNGHVVAERVVDTVPGAITIFNPAVHLKKIHYETDQLFMVHFANGFKRYYYVQDSTINNWFTREEMWMYMKGERDGRAGFKAKGAFAGSIAAGFIGGMTGTIWGPVAPYTFMALTALPKVRIEHHTVSDPKNLESDAYILGYERVARKKMKIRSLIGGGIGLLGGYAFYALFHNRYPENLNIGLGK